MSVVVTGQNLNHQTHDRQTTAVEQTLKNPAQTSNVIIAVKTNHEGHRQTTAEEQIVKNAQKNIVVYKIHGTTQTLAVIIAGSERVQNLN
jgi:predicted phosphodiesterase